MNYNKVATSLRRIAKQTLSQNDLAKSVIIQKAGIFYVFDQFTLQNVNNMWVVDGIQIDTHHEFHTSKSALAWCIAYIACRYELARRLRLLDHKIGSKQIDVELLIHRLENPELDNDSKAVTQHRLTEDIYSRQLHKEDLAILLKHAKYITIKGTYPNEPKRSYKTGKLKKSR